MLFFGRNYAIVINMCSIKLLDCTLREGGYVNNWEFGAENIQNILYGLKNAHMDFIECGYLKPVSYSSNKTLFNTINDAEKLTAEHNIKPVLMINYGEYNIKDIPNQKNIIFRIAFKKHQADEALKYCTKLKSKGYGIFIIPMHTNTYSANELSELINEVNKILPYGFTITDSTGSMRETDLKRVIKICKGLNENINICFHSHNNMQLSFSNAQYFIKNCLDRNIIIDSTLSGIGRGAGNLCTEIIALYLNNFCKGSYDINPILESIEMCIKPVFDKNPWGYSVPYYLSGLNNCHPDYAKFLINKSLSYDRINDILKKIPADMKSTYNEYLIKQLI